MKTLYLDCSMGAAGDMLTAALLELMPDPSAALEELNSLGIPGVHFHSKAVSKCGIKGTQISVLVFGEEESEALHIHGHEAHRHIYAHEAEHTHEPMGTHAQEQEHKHRGIQDIAALIDSFSLPEPVKKDIRAVYGLIAEAESQVHGRPVEEIHFHEVGTLDAVADVTAVCWLMHTLSPDRILASPVHVGSGMVRCAHGLLPVPAPATACILKDIPIYGGRIPSELCTPTGAALLKHFVTRFGEMPQLKVKAIGYGCGKKDFDAANCIRAFWGESDSEEDLVIELNCNVDDMTAEEISFAMERFFEAGALEAYTVPVGMKKGRPGTLIRVICRQDKKEALIRSIFKHTTTIGLRENLTRRHVLQRRSLERETPLGKVRIKQSFGYGVEKEKIEYEDLASLARQQDISLAHLRQMLEKQED